MRELAATLQPLAGGTAVAFAGAGLPTAVTDLLNDDVLTFLRRADRHQLGAVDSADVADALRTPLENTDHAITDDALGVAITGTGGYPFLIQLVGFWMCKLADTADDHTVLIDEAAAAAGVQAARRRLGSLIHEPALRDLSEVDRTFLAAMAIDDRPSRMADIALRPGSTQTSQLRLPIPTQAHRRRHDPLHRPRLHRFHPALSAGLPPRARGRRRPVTQPWPQRATPTERRSHYRSRMRDGLPLPGLTPQQVVSQLIHRVLGPLRPDRLRWVLDYYGLAGAPAAGVDETARRNRITVGMMTVQTSQSSSRRRRAPAAPRNRHRRDAADPRVTKTISVAHGSPALSGYPVPAAPLKPEPATTVSATFSELADRPGAPSGSSPRQGRWT